MQTTPGRGGWPSSRAGQLLPSGTLRTWRTSVPWASAMRSSRSTSVGALRPRVPVYAYTDIPALFRHLLILWGVEPFLMEFSADPEETIRNAFAYLKRRNWVKDGQTLVVITNALAQDKIIDTMQIRTVQ